MSEPCCVIRTAAILLVLMIAKAATAQFVEFPLPRKTEAKAGGQAARTQAVDPTFLPFFDDFSSSDTTLRDSLWLYGESVLLNNGTGIRPPSKNVVTFDGADSLGKPYNVNDVLAKGFADRLTSQPIRMDLVPVAERPTVYFSFFYQLEGHGELPDPGDDLTLAFKAQDGTWETVYILEASNEMLADTTFEQILIPVADDRFFHDAFQFRFSNYARLSGPYDTWNLDYIFLHKGRSSTDTSYPDRTVSSSFTSLFDQYFAMPIAHFLENVRYNLDSPMVELYNLKEFNDQPINYDTKATITSRVNGILSDTTVNLDIAQAPPPPGFISGLQFLNIELYTLPDSTLFNQLADSIHIHLDFVFDTDDNELPPFGDYDIAKYNPVDFRYSDSLTADYVLSNYYAYDDGTAEYMAGLNQAGSFLAFQFSPVTSQPDTLTFVDIYFPEFGESTSQSLLLQVRSFLGDINAQPLFEQLIVVNRTTMNKFSRYQLYRPIPVGATFYVGWKQLTNASIPVGLDKNTDNGDKVFFNINGNWVQNTEVVGSCMVRPGFGDVNGIVTATEQPRRQVIAFPNPTSGEFRINVIADRVEALDLTGRSVESQWEHEGNYTRVNISSPTPGLVVLRVLADGQLQTFKVMVLPAGKP